jgi:phytoene dehydrogenase-like protein
LSYAELVADGNSVTVFERAKRAGGALRYAGLAPQFQNVEANQRSLDAFVDDLERACREKNVVIRYGTEVSNLDRIAADFDRIVVATGARYRLGSSRLVRALLEAGWGKSSPVRRLFRSARVRDWFYYRARRSAVPRLGKLEPHRVFVIGDAAAPGKTREAIESAAKAAYFNHR